MMVTFISQCQKKALNRTRRVLDAFAGRIGDNAWQTVITEEGLIAVKTLLRKTATKNTAVACHWIRSRSRSELVWIVGNRKRFNAEGIVPVNTTWKKVVTNDWENNWHYLPVIKALVAVAALLHDWGKATALFQSKLQSNTRLGDPLRHEWISCLLLNALVQQSDNTDEVWLQKLANGGLDEAALKQAVANNTSKPLENLPPIAQLVGWLILTHHRLPLRDDPKQEANQTRNSLAAMLKSITAAWGYQNSNNDEKRLKACFEFPEGLLSQSAPWLKQLKKWLARLWQNQTHIQTLLDNGGYRVVLHHARLCLMLGDHFYSSCAADKYWQSSITLIANTDKQRKPKQKLDEHLVHVSQQALQVCQNLSRFSADMGKAEDLKHLRQKSSKGYEWQDKAVEKITQFKKQQPSSDKQHGWFIVNMASTGCGKTIANAKIMRALSEDGDSLRFVLALGLRTLTLQTGDEYRERIGLNNDELAVLIGSAAIQELHNKIKPKAQGLPSCEESGSESLEDLLTEELNFDKAPTADFLEVLFPKHNSKLADKNKAFLYKPVLACTIDHIIAATETKRGGKYILPCLRLLSSDLVIDEVDDFDGADLIAIGRLVHLAGMLGRKVMISSATIPPAVAEGLFNTYQSGWLLHSRFLNAQPQVACAWVDEFSTQVSVFENINARLCNQNYRQAHQQFIDQRVKKLLDQPIRRKAFIVDCSQALAAKRDYATIYFASIQKTAIDLHQNHHTVDSKTGKRVSFGVIRMANIPPCVELAQYLLKAEWPEAFAPKIMAYHSRQVLLLRHQQEAHLDAVLKRKEAPDTMPKAFSNPRIRAHLDSTPAENMLFIIVATPVEEVGRDHDFDWAVIEPSSFRSIIQLAGRVRRHRQTAITQANIAVMQYNLKALRHMTSQRDCSSATWSRSGVPVFYRPGYEVKSLKLNTPDVCELLDEATLNQVVNAIPRIQQPKQLRPKQQLADLEHQALNNSLTNYDSPGPQGLQAWLSEGWWLTAVPQQLNRFRDSSQDTVLHLLWQDGAVIFCDKTERGEFILYGERSNIKPAPMLSADAQARLWLPRDYAGALRQQINDDEQTMEEDEDSMMTKKSKRFGEITFREEAKGWLYSDQFGLYPRKV